MSIFNNKPALSQAIHEKVALPLDKKTVQPDQGIAVKARTTDRRSGFVYSLGSMWDAIKRGILDNSNILNKAIDTIESFFAGLLTTEMLVDVSVRSAYGLFVYPNMILRLEGGMLQQSWIQSALEVGLAIDVKILYEGGKPATAIPLSLIPFRATSSEVYEEVVAGSGTGPAGGGPGGPGGGGIGGFFNQFLNASNANNTQGGYGFNQTTAAAVGQLVGLSGSPPINSTGFIRNELMALSQAQKANIIAAAQTYGVDIAYVLAIIMIESSGDPRAGSTAGACGLMQIEPATFATLYPQLPQSFNLPNNIWDPSTNVFAGTLYMSQQLKSYGGDIRKMLIAYNGGPGEVQYFEQTGRTYAETTTYIQRFFNALKAIQADIARNTSTALNNRLETTSVDTTQASKNTGRALNARQGI